jgi:chromosome partitioning protein
MKFLPIQCEYHALRASGLLMRLRTRSARAERTRTEHLRAAYDDVRQSTNLNPVVVKEVRDHFQEVAFETVIPRTIRYGEAPSHGRTILEHDPSGSGAAAYRALAIEFLDRQKKGLSFVNSASDESTAQPPQN